MAMQACRRLLLLHLGAAHRPTMLVKKALFPALVLLQPPTTPQLLCRSALCPASAYFSSSSSSLSSSSSSSPPPPFTSLPSSADHDAPPSAENDAPPSPFPPPPSTLYGYFPKTLPAGPPPAGPFVLNTTLLRREYIGLQAASHPDKHPPRHRPSAESVSAAINHAYRTLASPLPRAQYLLYLRGVDTLAEDPSWTPDASLLATVLEAHEAIEQASTDDPHALDTLRSENNAHIHQCQLVLSTAFATDDIPLATREAIKLKYWDSIRVALDAWEETRAQT